MVLTPQHFIFFVTHESAQLASVFVPGKPFYPSLMFVSKAGTFLQGRLQASPTNIRLGWKGLPGTNSSLFERFKSFKEKKCYEYGPRVPSYRQTFRPNVIRLIDVWVIVAAPTND
jgi:hypothetical protein